MDGGVGIAPPFGAVGWKFACTLVFRGEEDFSTPALNWKLKVSSFLEAITRVIDDAFWSIMFSI